MGDTELTARAANVLNSVAKVQHNFETTKDLAKKARPLNSKMANADTLDGAGVNSGNALDAAKLQNNSETTKDLAKKNCLLSYHSALIAGASVKAASSSNRLHWVQMPSKQRIIPAEVAVPCISRLNLHPSQTESCSRRNRCSNRYPILRRYKGLAQQHFWDGHLTGRNLSPHSQRSWDGLSERVI